jgi:phytoene synthase
MELDTDTDRLPALRTTLDYCHAEVRRHDPERYFATLFAPAAARDHILSLYAFEGELKRVRSSVSNPLLGEIRLQWWAESVEGLYQGAVREHPVVKALAETVRANRLPQERLAAIVEGHFADIAEEDRRRSEDIARFARSTTGAVSRLAASILDGGPATLDGAETAGTAWGLTVFVRSVPHRNDTAGALRAAVPDVCAMAEQHVADVRARYGGLSRTCLPVFLPAALASRYLMRFKAGGYGPETLLSEIAVPRTLMTLYLAALRYRLRNRRT